MHLKHSAKNWPIALELSSKYIITCQSSDYSVAVKENNNGKLYSPQMLVTTYNKIRNDNNLTKKRKMKLEHKCIADERQCNTGRKHLRHGAKI